MIQSDSKYFPPSTLSSLPHTSAMSLTQYCSRKQPAEALDQLIIPDHDSDRLLPLRLRSQQWIRDPALRYCDESFLREHSRSSLVPILDMKRIYQKICTWYKSWSSAQQKVLLCSLTDVCTTTQLESIATSLEPLFHSEVLQERNTMRPLTGKMGRKKKKVVATTNKIQEKNWLHRVKVPSLPVCSETSRMLDIQEETDRRESTDLPRYTGIPSSPSDMESLKHTSNKDISSPVSTHDIADEVVHGAMDDTMSLIKSKKHLPQIARKADVYENVKQPQQSKFPPVKSLCGSQVETVYPKMVSRTKKTKKKLALKALDKRVKSQYHNALDGHQLTALRPVTQSFTVVHSRHRLQVASQESVLKYFSQHDMSKGPLQAHFLERDVRPPGPQHATIPVQNMYKSAAFFGKSPRTGSIYVPPEKGKLSSIFMEQIRQIQEWVDHWKPFERLKVLTMIMKVSSHTLLIYTAHCLLHRLQERVDISWLADSLLIKIFGFLPGKDIYSCSEVCRRWYYVAGDEKLWKDKLKKLGRANGIKKIINLISEMNKDQEEIDWRIAFSEMENNVNEKLRLREKAKLQEAYNESGQSSTRSSAQTIVGGLPSMKRWHAMIDKGPRMKLGHILAKQSDKLKERYRISLQNDEPRMHARQMASQDAVCIEEEASTNERFMMRRATAVTIGSMGCPSPIQLHMTADVQYNSTETCSSNNMLAPSCTLPSTGPAMEHALDVAHDLVPAIDLLGKDKLKHLDSWIVLACNKNEMDAKPREGGIQSIARVRKLSAHMDAVLSFEYDHKRFISGGADRSIRVWDIRSGCSIHKLVSHKGSVGALLLDVNTLYSGSWDTTIMVWDLRYFERVAVLYGHRGSITDLRLARDRLLSSAHDGTVRVWTLGATHECVHVLPLHTNAIMSLQYDSMEDNIITGSSDRTIKVTSLHTHQTLCTMKSKDPINCLILQAGLIISTNYTGQVTFWNKYDGSAEAMIQAHKERINTLGFRGGCFYTGSDDMTIKEWDLMSMVCLRSLAGCKGGIQRIRLGSTFMVSTDSFGEIRIWDYYGSSLNLDQKENNDVLFVKHIDEAELEAFLNGEKQVAIDRDGMKRNVEYDLDDQDEEAINQNESSVSGISQNTSESQEQIA